MVLTGRAVVKSFVLLLMSFLYIIIAYPIYTLINALTNDTMLSAQMFIIFWLIMTAMTYIPIIRTLENKGYIPQQTP